MGGALDRYRPQGSEYGTWGKEARFVSGPEPSPGRSGHDAGGPQLRDPVGHPQLGEDLVGVLTERR